VCCLEYVGQTIFKCPRDCQKQEYAELPPLTKKTYVKLRVQCKRHSSGCKQYVEIGLIEKHEDRECGYRTARCVEFEVCEQLLLFKDKESHEAQCQYTFVSCEHCQESFRRGKLPGHVPKCDKLPVTCEFCVAQFTQEDLRTHIKTCPEKDEQCERCGKAMKYKDIGTHDCVVHLKE
jgi:hypothetical protein